MDNRKNLNLRCVGFKILSKFRTALNKEKENPFITNGDDAYLSTTEGNFEYDEFYRENVQPINAIWIGSGITEQFTIKSSTYTKETRSQIPNDFGYNIDRGNAIYVKFKNNLVHSFYRYYDFH